MKALDRYTLRIKLAEPGPRFYHLAEQPSARRGRAEVDEMYDENEMMANPVGTGPYRLDDWRRSSRIVLEKNPELPRRLFINEQRQRRLWHQLASANEGPQAAADRSRRGLHHRRNQPRWLAFLNGEHDLVDEIPYDMANLIVPNGKLAPNPSSAASRWTAITAPVSIWRCSIWSIRWLAATRPTRSRCAARSVLGLRDATRSGSCARGQSIPSQSPVSPLTYGYDPAFKSEMSDYNPRAQGAARLVRLRRSRRRRLARRPMANHLRSRWRPSRISCRGNSTKSGARA